MSTKIIATVRRDREKEKDERHIIDNVKRLIENGIKELRFNVSKWRNNNEMNTLIYDIERIREEFCEYNLKIILDLPYPYDKPRLSIPDKKAIYIFKDQKICLQSMNEKEIETECIKVMVNSPKVGDVLKNKDTIYYADGLGNFKVHEIVNESNVILIAQNDMELEHKKSITLGKNVICEEYKESFLELVKKVNPHAVALSFVENAKDVITFKSFFPNQKFEVISKIETEAGVNNLEEIAKVSDSIILGRGDLGLHMNISKIWFAQKRAVQVAEKNNIPIYIATDILSTLEKRYIPSRADVTDLTNMLLMNPAGIVLTYGLTRCSKIELATKIINEVMMEIKENTWNV